MGIHEASIKISEEMKKERNNPYVKVVGEFLLKEVVENNDAAEAIANSNKTIMGSLEAMRAEAAKKKTGNYAVLTDDEGFNIVCVYYGFERVKVDCLVVKTPDIPKEVNTESKVIEFKPKTSKKEVKKAKKTDNVDGQVSLFDF